MRYTNTGICEHRLIGKGDFRQGFEDLQQFHVRTDGPIEMAGSVIMAPAVALTKFGNTLAGEFSDHQAEPLKEGGLKYISRDVRSAAGNLFQAGKNLVTLHPLRAAGNLVKAGFDGVDIVFVDPLLDAGSAAFRHTRRQVHSTLAA